jgi:hypothetical protein
MATTYGSSGQPAQSTFNYDALVATSLANYRKTLQDNVSASNSFFKEITWRSEDGGLYVAEDLMYELTPVDSYEGYDELPTTPTNGITQAQFQWSQCATPIAISEKERKQNKHRIVNLVTSKIMQAEIAMKEFYPKAFLQGGMVNGSGSNLYTAYTSLVNGSTFVDPLGKLVYYEAASTWPSLSIGGIDQNTNSWWRNQSDESGATTATGFMNEILHMYNLCSKGPGGPPDLILCDQVTWELVHQAYRLYFQNTAKEDGNFPFPNIKFFGSRIVWDEYVPDVSSGTTSTATYGSMYFLNTKFFNCAYEAETNFVPTDFQRPTNQDAKFKHILWMGTVTMSNRRKHGVIGKIARTLTQS